MATGKKFYWLKLKVDFLNSEVIDYILSQKNGSDYLAIYLILCTKTINTQGELVNQLGEVIIPYDVEKIQRDCKHFHIDTIRVAMELFSKLKLIYMQENGILKITGYEDMVGSATDYAKQKALQRKTKDNSVDNVHIEIRDKRLEIRDIDNNITTTNTLIDFWNENFRLITPFELQKIQSWQKDFSDEMLLLSLEECVKQNKRSMSYFEGILKNWKSKGYKVPADIERKETKGVPDWYDKEIVNEKISKEESEELRKLLQDFK